MTEYRKFGPRTFYKIHQDHVISVVNMYNRSSIELIKDRELADYISIDLEVYKAGLTESEFNEQYEIAMERIKNQSV